MAEITNDLTWSISRAGLFQSCQRAYYYRYYGYWGGWKFDADEKAKLLYVLRNVKPMILWAGTIVHETIKDALTRYAATGEVPTLPALQQHATELLRAGWLETINKEWQERPSKKTNLFELYYGDGENYGECKKLPREQTDAIKERVMSALDAFSRSQVLKDILATSTKQWQPIDANLFFMLDDIKVWACPDFAYTDASSILHIIDWKTGKEHPAQLRLQLACYALYAIKTLNVPLENVAIHGVLLNDFGRRSDYQVDQALIDSVTSQIKVSFNAMKKKLKDAEKNLAEEDDFPCNPSDFNCSTCPFLRVCPAVQQ